MLKHITMTLARSSSFPDGSNAHGYEIVAPLREDGHLDHEAWRSDQALCTVRRFRPGEDDRHGRLAHRPGGAGGGHWVLDYDPLSDSDDESAHRLDAKMVRMGEYITLTDEKGTELTYRVDEVRPYFAPASAAS